MPYAGSTKKKQTQLRYYKRNKNKLKRYARVQYKKNREYYLAWARNWRRQNPEICKTRQSLYQKTHKEQFAAYRSIRRTRQTKAGGFYTLAQWSSLCSKYHNKCLRCGKKKRLTPDHVIPVFQGGTSDIRNIQPLCKPCNSSKGTKTTDYRLRKGSYHV